MFQCTMSPSKRHLRIFRSVKITIRTDIQELSNLNHIIEKDCNNLHQTWIQFIRKYSKTAYLPSRKYQIERSRFPGVALSKKVGDIIKLYKNNRKVYIVRLVKRKKTKKQIQRPRQCHPEISRNTVIVPRGHPERSSTNTALVPDGNPEISRNTVLVPHCDPIMSRTSTKTVLVPHGQPGIFPEYDGLPCLTPNYRVDHIKNEVEFGSFGAFSQKEHWNEVVPSINSQTDDEFDIESILSTGSQDSQADLRELGIQFEDIKEKVSQCFDIVTSVQLCSVRKEMARNMDCGRHQKFTKLSNKASSFLVGLFRDFTGNQEILKEQFVQRLTNVNNHMLLQIRDELTKNEADRIVWNKLGLIAPKSKNLLTTVFKTD